MALKGLDRITDILDNYAECYFDISVEPDGDFAYYHEDETITYSVMETQASIDVFMGIVHDIEPRLTIDPFLITFFHEIGHQLSWDENSEEEWTAYWDHVSYTEDLYEYMTSPVEIRATRAGINYIMTHQDEVSALWSELQPALLNFYKLNNIE